MFSRKEYEKEVKRQLLWVFNSTYITDIVFYHSIKGKVNTVNNYEHPSVIIYVVYRGKIVILHDYLYRATSFTSRKGLEVHVKNVLNDRANNLIINMTYIDLEQINTINNPNQLNLFND